MKLAYDKILAALRLTTLLVSALKGAFSKRK